jgi:hypothetical protein
VAVKFTHNGPQGDLIAQLRGAWIEMRYHFPSIANRWASESTGENVMFYESPSSSELEDWLRESFQVHRTATAAEVERKLMREPIIKMHYCASSSELLLQSEHIFLDGRGALYLFEAFFEALSSPAQDIKFGGESQRLTPALEDVVEMPKDSTDGQRTIARRMVGDMAPPAPITFPVPDVNLKHTREIHRRALKLDKATTAAAVKRCKQLGVSVTSAWHAAVTLATQRIQGHAGAAGETLATFTNFDSRRWATLPGFESCKHPVSCYYIAALSSTTPAGRDLPAIATELNHFYKTAFTPGGERLAAYPAFVGMVSQAFVNGPPPGSTPILSSLGILENFIGRSYGPQAQWELEDIWIGDFMLTANIETFLWTWKGRMVLSSCANTAFYTEHELDGYLGAVRDLLLTGLDVYA